MFSNQNISPCLHRIHVQIMFDLPDQSVCVGRGRAPREDAKQILTLLSGKACMKITRHRGAARDRNGVGFKVIVQRL